MEVGTEDKYKFLFWTSFVTTRTHKQYWNLLTVVLFTTIHGI